MFDKFDSNDDDKISVSELIGVLRSMGTEGRAPPGDEQTRDEVFGGVVYEMIKGVDSDGDVRVNCQKFEKMMAASGEAAAPVPNSSKK
ncbi:hypothetical protein LINPERHAP2_LOCUS35116 [Linum perenne]